VARIPSLEVRTAADADTLEGGRQATRTLLATGFTPTAISSAVNDVTAVGALRELRERGLRVPKDVSVTGFDNLKLSEFCYPALTTVHYPARSHRAYHLRLPGSEGGKAGRYRCGNRESIRNLLCAIPPGRRLPTSAVEHAATSVLRRGV